MKPAVTLLMIFLWPPLDIWGGEADDYLGWRLLSGERLADGRHLLTFELALSAPGPPLEELEAFYAAAPLSREGEPEFHSLPVRPGQPVAIYSGRSERLELHARARRGGTAYYAGTIINAYGASGQREGGQEEGGRTVGERLAAAPAWPGFELLAGPKFYRAAAGTELTLRLSGPRPERAEAVEIFEGRRRVTLLRADDEGLYRHTPALEDGLSEAGYRAKKDLWLVAWLPGAHGGPGEPGAPETPETLEKIVSFYLPVYRAFYGRISLKGGLAVLAAAALCSGLALRRRKFPWR